MKTIEYYCSNHFNPTSATTMLAADWLEAKIVAAELTISDLLNIHYTERDNVRIRLISKAIKHWTNLLNEIRGIHSHIDT